jgi:sugar lactone lactonase YvrE
VVSAASGEAQTLSGDGLSVPLEAYQMRAFRAAGAATITGCTVQTPAEEKTRLETTLHAAEQITAGLRDRTLAPELTQDEAQAAEDLVAEARKAFTEGRYCRARLNLERPALIRVYDLAGLYPTGLQDRPVPHGLTVTSAQAAPGLEFAGATSLLDDTRGKGSAVKDLAYAPDGSLWVSTPEQLMLLDGTGKYVRSMRLSPPPKLDQGDARWSGLQPPVYLTPQAIRVLRDGRLATQIEYNQPLTLCEAATGRVLPLAEGESFPLPAGQAWHLDVDATGHLYVVVYGNPETTGLYKFRPDGASDFAFGGANPSNRLGERHFGGVAVDGAGRIYLSDPEKNQILVCAPDGGLVTNVDVKEDGGPRRLVVTPDGMRIYVATAGQSVVALQRGAQGEQYAELWKQALGAPVAALALGAQGQVAVGFAKPVDGAVARSYTAGDTGLQAGATLVPALQPDFPRYLTQATRLKVHQGAVYFLSDNQICRLTPGDPDKVEAVYKPPSGDVVSFTLAPNGDLYFATTWAIGSGPRGQWIYRCAKNDTGWDKPVSITGEQPFFGVPHSINPFDMVVEASGRLIVRWQSSDKDDWTHMVIFARQPDGTSQQLVDVGSNGANGPWSLFYGVHEDGQGRIYVAGGPTRQVICLSPEGKELWRTGWEAHQGPGCVPVRGPWAVTTDSRGFVWVADTDGNRLECLDASGKVAGFTGHGGGVDARDGAGFCWPTGIATVKDAAGTEWLYVADMGNQRILKYRIK